MKSTKEIIKRGDLIFMLETLPSQKIDKWWHKVHEPYHEPGYHQRVIFKQLIHLLDYLLTYLYDEYLGSNS